MDVDKQHLRHCILFCFQMKKNAAQAMELINSTLGEHSVSHSTVKKWFARFREGNFSLVDAPRPGAVKKFDDKELQVLLDKNPCQTQEELGKQLGVSHQAISLRLHAMGKIQKENKVEFDKKMQVSTCTPIMPEIKIEVFDTEYVAPDIGFDYSSKVQIKQEVDSDSPFNERK